MAWNPKGGGPWGGGGGGPWGGGPTPTPPPNIEDLLRRSQERFQRFVPSGIGGGRGLLLALAAVLAVWLATGFYRVQPGEQGVELMFGRFVKVTTPGLNYWFPAPIGEVLTPNVEQTNQITIGFRGGEAGGRAGATRDVPQESLMLTSDQNIIDVDFLVQWRIKNAADYLFNLRDPETTVKLAAESAFREVMGQTSLEEALTIRRQQVDDQTKELTQAILDGYGAGVLLVDVKQLKVDPPAEVIDAFNDVQRARQDQERSVNEALTYRNDIVPRARGEAERIIQDSAAYREKAVRDAEGEAKRFISVHDAYLTGRDVTLRRLYLERMQDVLAKSDKVVIDPSSGGTGVVPYLPLPELSRRKAEETRR
ncbi:MAG: FtsH protease activity modulator HflK [Defluviicoccus sp.]|nr:FtsH protease activity modulator HflK [Defluviicoccus sp.]MDG4594040.1 FtsH protease activity modulator HflK [Defluviicoccus sp.]MDS4011364.1 FtsH protease activity modulator HflK [Defluviicoccus sp.]MDS4072086.1 FtsH protease activity modulator HflK [Defluviicoccus sp.]